MNRKDLVQSCCSLVMSRKDNRLFCSQCGKTIELFQEARIYARRAAWDVEGGVKKSPSVLAAEAWDLMGR